MAKRNNHGFTLIEMIVVTAMVVVIAGIAGAGISSAFGARSSRAAKTVDGMISQSKINALSGRRNCMVLSYSEDDKCFKCALYEIENGVIADKPYEEEDVGNAQLEIKAGEISLKSSPLNLEFNMDTGAVKSLSAGSVTLLDSSTPQSTVNLNFNFYTGHVITIYRSTGEHTFD